MKIKVLKYHIGEIFEKIDRRNLLFHKKITSSSGILKHINILKTFLPFQLIHAQVQTKAQA